MYISDKVWTNYIAQLRKVNDKAAQEMFSYLANHEWSLNRQTKQAAIDYAFALATKYGEGAAAAACEMYDAIAQEWGRNVLQLAEPADTATYAETAKAINGTAKTGNIEIMADAVGRLVKMAGVDTTMKNAIRDGAEWAWIPRGDTCAFCITLASRGWQKASAAALKGGHAEHIHANCDCTYAIRFDSNTDVEGYDPSEYRAMYDDAEGNSSKDKINAMRRSFYAMNKESGLTNLNSSASEEFTFTKASKAILDFEKKRRTAKTEYAILTDSEGNVFETAKGSKSSVKIGPTPEAGYISSHNHPIDSTFSVPDVRFFEEQGFKQDRVVSSEKTYILEAINPKKIPNWEDRAFTNAMSDAWDAFDEEADRKRIALRNAANNIQDRDERRKYYQQGINKLVEWRYESENKWLKTNAPKYGYRYTTQKATKN